MIINQLAKFFFSSLIWGISAATIRLPPLLGYILSGILLGPSVNKYMSPETVEYIKLIGEFGLLMLMFVAGLELDISEFTGKDNEWVRPILTVFYQILCAFTVTLIAWVLPEHFLKSHLILGLIGLGAIVLLIILQKLTTDAIDQSRGHLAAAGLCLLLPCLAAAIYFRLLPTNSLLNVQTMVMVGCILSLNSTAVAIKLLENRDKKNTFVGTSVISILIAQDLAVIIMLITLESLGSSSLSVISLLLKVFIAVFILYLVKVLSDYSPSWISDFLDYLFRISKELTALFAVTLCFTFAAIAQSVGFSDIYGAFIAGLTLGNVYKHDKYIIKICEPISNILMTMFFMWLGILFNISEIMSHLFPIAVITTLIMAFKYLTNSSIIKGVYNHGTGLTSGCVTLCSIILTQMSEFSIVMIGQVTRGLSPGDLAAATTCDIVKASVISSLSIGSIVAVVIKNWLYKQKYIE